MRWCIGVPWCVGVSASEWEPLLLAQLPLAPTVPAVFGSADHMAHAAGCTGADYWCPSGQLKGVGRGVLAGRVPTPSTNPIALPLVMAAPMVRFLSQSYRRYLRILADPSDELQRKIVVKLLAEEKATRREGARNKEEPP